MPDLSLTRRPARYTAILPPNQLNDLPLEVGDGDGFLAVLEDEPERLVIGTSPAWNRVYLIWMSLGGLLMGIGLVTSFLSRNPDWIATLPWTTVLVVVGLIFAQHFRNRWVFDREHGEVVRITWLGLRRHVVPLDQVAEVAVGGMKFVDLHDVSKHNANVDEMLAVAKVTGRTDEPDPDEILAVVLHTRKGRRLAELHGPASSRPEAAFHLMAAARAAAVTGKPLRLIALPDQAGKSLTALWRALAAADPVAIDAWWRRYPMRPRKPWHRRPEVSLVALAVVGLVSAVHGLIGLSLSVMLSSLSIMLTALLITLIGLRLSEGARATGGPRPAAESVGLSWFGGKMAWAGQVMFVAAVFSPAAFNDKLRERPRLEYFIQTMPDGKRFAVVNARNMNRVDVGLALLTKPEPEAREEGLRELDRNVDRNHPRRADVLKGMEQFLPSGDRHIRKLAVTALGNWGTAETVAVLEKMSEDPEKSVRDEAAYQIQRIQDREKRGQN